LPAASSIIWQNFSAAQFAPIFRQLVVIIQSLINFLSYGSDWDQALAMSDTNLES
jgi:hypothetical protein